MQDNMGREGETDSVLTPWHHTGERIAVLC